MNSLIKKICTHWLCLMMVSLQSVTFPFRLPSGSLKTVTITSSPTARKVEAAINEEYLVQVKLIRDNTILRPEERLEPAEVPTAVVLNSPLEDFKAILTADVHAEHGIDSKEILGINPFLSPTSRQRLAIKIDTFINKEYNPPDIDFSPEVSLINHTIDEGVSETLIVTDGIAYRSRRALWALSTLRKRL